MEDYRDLIATAGEQTGLADFGGDSFVEGLEILVRSLNIEARLNAVGEHAIRDRILLHLRQRLLVEDWYARHPEIDAEEIAAPLFGVSLPRTGSTALSFLLSSDPAIRYLRVWESGQPCPPPSTVQGPDPRRGQSASSLDGEIKGGQRTPTGIDGAMECQDLMALDFRSQIFLAFARVPTYAHWLLDADLESTYAYEKRVLKLLQWGEPTRRWRLKAPSHLLYLPALDKVFPDSRFVMTHRDPAEVLLSVCVVYESIMTRFTDELDRAWIGEVNLKSWAEGMDRAVAFREAGNAHRFHDIHFKAMHRDPLAEVRALYAWLGEPVTPAFGRAMTAWWEQNNAGERPAKPDPALYGLDPAQVRARFADYRRHMAEWAPEPAAA
jgi:hypothetical protein